MISLSNVDFPAPDGAAKAINSPGLTSRLAFLRSLAHAAHTGMKHLEAISRPKTFDRCQLRIGLALFSQGQYQKRAQDVRLVDGTAQIAQAKPLAVARVAPYRQQRR
jgi:hypothetical protein